jgi:hypothetical protein
MVPNVSCPATSLVLAVVPIDGTRNMFIVKVPPAMRD